MHEHEHAEGRHHEGRSQDEIRHDRRFRHGHGRHGGRRGFDPWFGEGEDPFNREALLAKLERYQRDLEERTADVADMIRRLKEPASSAQPSSTTAV